jgi:TonB-linked SusC/RagA family outer membrane protein
MNNKNRKALLKRMFCLLVVGSIYSSMYAYAYDLKEGSTGMQEQQQTKITVNGKVTDASGEPLAGVSVVVKGLTQGVMTDADGNYTITTDSGTTLVFTYVGFKSQSVVVGAKNKIDVVLEDNTKELDEVVVTALGIKKEKKALGYAVQDLNSAELLKNKTANPLNSLAGKVAGVNVNQTNGGAGAGASIILRGATSLNENRDNQPLFVVDGVIYDNSLNQNGNSLFDGATSDNSTYSNRLMDINPEDIENVSVLKGPAAAALYGSRAAAGVILITTKKGQEGRVEVNFSSKFQTSWANRYPEQQNTYKRGLYQQDGTLQQGDETTTMESWGARFNAGETVYNNIENFFQAANTYDNAISVSGGSKNGSFYLSASNYDQTGIIPNSSYDKTTFRFNGEQKYGKLKMGANVAYSIADQLSSLTSGGLYGSNGEGAVQATYIWPRDLDMTHWLNEDGSKYRLFPNELIQNDYDNPYWILNKMSRTDNTKRFTGSLNANFEITNWWNVGATVGLDRYTTDTRRFSAPQSGISLIYQKGLLSENERTYEYVTSNVMTTFHKAFGDFDLNLLLGTTSESTSIDYNGRKAWNFIIPEFYVVTNVANTDLAIAQSKTQKRLVGAYGEFRAAYKNFAYLTVTGRNDWTSTLPINNRSYFYPSVSGSLVFTELLPKSNILSYGKVRASWARVGKDADPYVTNTYVNSPEFTIYNNGEGTGIRDSWTRGNPYLIPEITESQEYGIDMKFLDNRIGMEFTYYNNRSIDQLLQPRTGQTPGYIYMTANGGVLSNKGWELSLNVVPVKTKDFTWDMTINASSNKGTVEELLSGQNVLYVTDVQFGGAQAASFLNGNFLGISGTKWKRSPEGHLVLNADNGMPLSAGTELFEIGNREPKLFGGINNSLTWKNWNLSFLLDYRIGGDVFNGTDAYMTGYGQSARSASREKLNITGVVQIGGTSTDPVYSEPKTFEYEAGKMYTVGNQTMSGEYIINHLYWKNAYTIETANYLTKVNWLRLRTVSLSYTFPQSLLGKQKVVKGLTATATGTNLLLLTNYKGMDPETSASGTGRGSGGIGIDYCGVPALAGFSFGINVTF